jgi:hypothetical protein
METDRKEERRENQSLSELGGLGMAYNQVRQREMEAKLERNGTSFQREGLKGISYHPRAAEVVGTSIIIVRGAIMRNKLQQCMMNQVRMSARIHKRMKDTDKWRNN